MIKIFLVEDEMISLKGLKQKILDLEMDFDVVGTALSADDAILHIGDNLPHIVITDIMMPGKDGLALIEELKIKYPSIMFIIASGYNEFEYAKRALRLGVENYLLKPIQVTELKNCLTECVQKLIQQQSVVENTVLSLLTGDSPVFAYNTNSDIASFVIVYMIAHNCIGNIDDVIHPTVPFVSVETLEKLMAQYVKLPFSCFNGIISNEKMLIINVRVDGLSGLVKQLELALPSLVDISGFGVTLYISEVCPTVAHNMSDKINACRRIVRENLVLGESAVLTGNTFLRSCRSRITSDVVNLCGVLLSNKQFADLRKKLKGLFKDWSGKMCPLYYVEKDLLFLTDSLKLILSKQSIYEFDSNEYIKNIICSAGNYDELCSGYYSMLIDLFGNTTQNDKMSSKELAINLIEYLGGNLSKSITLQGICEYLGVSQVYLCRVFKSITGYSPIDYFTKMKIDKAKSIMQEYPDMSFKDVASTMGFSDPYYFSKVFKKMEGISPSEYKKLL